MPTANIKTEYAAYESVMYSASLHSLASSATAGWCSGYENNTSNKYLDAIVNWTIDPANTAPANDKAFYLFGYGMSSLSYYPSTGAATGGTVGTEGALTFPNITTTPILLKLIDTLYYSTADVALNSSSFSMCKRMGWRRLPMYWGVAVLNYSGAALAASGNRIAWYGSYDTVT